MLDEWRDALEESAQHYDPAAQARIVTETLLEVIYDDDTPLWQVCIDAAGRILATGIRIENASSGPLELVHIELPDDSKRHEVRVSLILNGSGQHRLPALVDTGVLVVYL